MKTITQYINPAIEMREKYIYIAALLLVMSSCATRKAANRLQMASERECIELYGELETREIHVVQDLVWRFGINPPIWPIHDTVVIAVPNKPDPNMIYFGYAECYTYSNSADVYIFGTPSDELEFELRQRIWDAGKRILFPNSETNPGETYFVPETTVTEGIDENGLCWKIVNFEFMSYGYSRVPPEHKWFFDRILKSFHKKTPSYQEVFDELSKKL